MFTAKKFCLIFSLALCAIPLYAGGFKSVLPNSESLKWVPVKSFPPGVEMAVLVGNPEKPGFFTAQVKFPANYTVPVHTHPIAEYDTVIYGTVHMGSGRTINHDATVALPAGTFFSVPANTPHFGFTKKMTIVQVSGMGPWGVVKEKKAKG